MRIENKSPNALYFDNKTGCNAGGYLSIYDANTQNLFNLSNFEVQQPKDAFSV